MAAAAALWSLLFCCRLWRRIDFDFKSELLWRENPLPTRLLKNYRHGRNKQLMNRNICPSSFFIVSVGEVAVVVETMDR